VCSALGTPCGAPLECAGGSGAALGVCAPTGASCIGDECGAAAPICLFTNGGSLGRCVTASERGCVCRGPVGRMVFDCEGVR
jgi:hypothetical protein